MPRWQEAILLQGKRLRLKTQGVKCSLVERHSLLSHHRGASLIPVSILLCSRTPKGRSRRFWSFRGALCLRRPWISLSTIHPQENAEEPHDWLTAPTSPLTTWATLSSPFMRKGIGEDEYQGRLESYQSHVGPTVIVMPSFFWPSQALLGLEKHFPVAQNEHLGRCPLCWEDGSVWPHPLQAGLGDNIAITPENCWHHHKKTLGINEDPSPCPLYRNSREGKSRL